MELFDTHMHLPDGATPRQVRDDSLSTLAQYRDENGVAPFDSLLFMACGCNPEECAQVQNFARDIYQAYFAAGIHPHHAETYSATDTAKNFDVFYHDEKCRAVGEIGLDYFYDFAPRSLQIPVFEAFLKIAQEKNLPAIVHLRDKENSDLVYHDALKLLTDFAAEGGKFVVHSFAGTPEFAEKFLALGGWCGVTGMVTFKRADNIRETLKVIPLDKLLLETDSPYLTPFPFRGKPNCSGMLPYIVAQVAREKGKSLREVAEITVENGIKFFNLREIR